MQAVALYAYDASTPDELSFVAGDRIEVTSTDQTWWIGRRGDAVGCFPSNYVELISNEWDDDASDASSKKAPADVGELGKLLGAAISKARGTTASSKTRGTGSRARGATDDWDDDEAEAEVAEMRETDINDIGRARPPSRATLHCRTAAHRRTAALPRCCAAARSSSQLAGEQPPSSR